MTALTEFQRLEATGAWRPRPQDRLREVVVSVGDATLILTDPKSETPLAHWSLPAVIRLNPGKVPAIYAPGSDQADETLEVDDPLMIDAIARVHKAIAARRAHPGRLRVGLGVAALAVMLVGAVIWLPGALTRHAVAIAPPAQAQAIGAQVLADVARSTGAACSRPSSDSVLAHLAGKLLPPGSRIHVLPTALGRAILLPGDHYLIGTDLIVDQPDPDVASGHLLAASLGGSHLAPLGQALDYAGIVAVLQLLTSGKLPSSALQGYGEELLTQPGPPPPVEQVLALFQAKSVPVAPYAQSLAAGDAAAQALISADPMAGQPMHELLSDQQWLALQRICTD